MQDVRTVADFYESTVGVEWRRLDASWLERAITNTFLQRHLGTKSAIIDIGGGPGRYALDLAADGHDVDLIDLSPANVAFARERAAEAGVRLRSARAGDARDLSVYADAAYDLALNLGPLYHLMEREDRERTVRETLRVLRPGGVAFFAFLSSYAPIHFVLKTSADAIDTRLPMIREVLQTGLLHAAKSDGFFTDAVFVDPLEIEPFLEACGAEPTEIFGAEGIMAQSEARLAALDPQLRQEWLQLAITTATTPAALFGSEHIVAICRKES